MKTPNRGGARPGAGKPRLYEEPMRNVTVKLDDGTLEKARRIGDGNLSAGIREAVRRVKEKAK